MSREAGKDDQPGQSVSPGSETDSAADGPAPAATEPASPVAAETARATPWEAKRPEVPQQQPPARSRWFVALVCTLLILVAVAAGGWLLHQRIEAVAARQTELQPRQDALGKDLATVKKDVAELSKRIDAVSREVASLPATAPPAPAAPAADPALAGGLADLGRRLDDLEQRSAALSQQAAGLDRQVAELTAAPGAPKALLSRIDQLEGDSLQSKRLADRLRELEAGAAVTKDQVGELTATVLALNQLRDALAGSGAYQQPLQSLQALSLRDAAVQDALQVLAPRAATGIPSLELLKARFPAVASAVKRAEFTVAGEGWWERSLSRITGLVTLRRTGPHAIAGGGTDAALATAEQALAVGDLPAAVDAVAGIEGEGVEAAAPWLQDARSRLMANQALADLYGHALARLKALKG